MIDFARACSEGYGILTRPLATAQNGGHFGPLCGATQAGKQDGGIRLTDWASNTLGRNGSRSSQYLDHVAGR